MKLLELFAGSRSIWKVAEKLGFNVFSSDINNFEKIDYNVDILKFDFDKIPFIPDILWASPPCTTFSIASCWHHRKPWNHTKEADLWDKIIIKTLEIIKYYLTLNPKLIWYIENPRGLLRKMDFMQNIGTRQTVTYCQYWDNRMKPTDIWTNNVSWIPKKMCKNGDSCHVSAPRGSKTGTQGLKSAYLRSIIPKKLCYEVLNFKK